MMKRYTNLICMAVFAISSALSTCGYAKENLFFEKSVHSQSEAQHSKKSSLRAKEGNLSPWIEQREGTMVFKFNAFNLDPDNVDQKNLQKIFKGIVADSWKNYAKDYSFAADIIVYTADRISDPELYNGDRIPIFVGNFVDVTGNFLGFHAIQTPPDYGSFFVLNNNITQVLGIEIPSNFPDFTPYAAVNSGTIKNFLGNGHWAGNPYAYNKPGDLYNVISFACSHEVKEILGDDEIQNWVILDNFAPTVANWKFAIYDKNHNPINGKVGPDGYVHLPSFTDLFPDGFQATIIQENGDAVSRSTAGKLQSYFVKGHPFAQSNYPLSTFWKPYYTASDLKYDHKGLTQLPCQPFAGLHEPFLVNILDLGNGLFGPGVSQFAEVLNWGPVTSKQRAAESKANYGPGWSAKANNFPPDYTIVSLYGIIAQ